MPPIIFLKSFIDVRPIRLRSHLSEIIFVFFAPFFTIHTVFIISKDFIPIFKPPFRISTKGVRGISLKRNLYFARFVIDKQRPFSIAQIRIATSPFSVILRHVFSFLSFVVSSYHKQIESQPFHIFFINVAGRELPLGNSTPCNPYRVPECLTNIISVQFFVTL